MSIRLSRWGHSTGLRVPVSILSAAGLAPGRYVTLRVLDNGEIRVRPVGQLIPADSGSAIAAIKPNAEPAETKW